MATLDPSEEKTHREHGDEVVEVSLVVMAWVEGSVEVIVFEIRFDLVRRINEGEGKVEGKAPAFVDTNDAIFL